MCHCCNNGRLTYAQMYNDLYVAPDKADWIRSCVRKSKNNCLSRRLQVLRHITTALRTQGCLASVQKNLYDEILNESVNEHKVYLTRIRRLSRFMLKHSYRPHGRNFYRGMRNFMKSNT